MNIPVVLTNMTGFFAALRHCYYDNGNCGPVLYGGFVYYDMNKSYPRKSRRNKNN